MRRLGKSETDVNETSVGLSARRTRHVSFSSKIGRIGYIEKVTGFAAQEDLPHSMVSANDSLISIESDDAHRSVEQIVAVITPILEKFHTILRRREYAVPDAAFMVHRDNVSFDCSTFAVADNVRLLTAWDVICHLVAKAYAKKEWAVGHQAFGTGFYLRADEGEGCQVSAICTRGPSECPYILVNAAAKCVREGVEAAITGEPYQLTGELWRNACHELAHLVDIGGGHNEEFSARREAIAHETSYVFSTMRHVVSACFDNEGITGR